ncbi:MAG: hypothetical protein M1482_04190 [Chloroflexi bacterium]|nr:hypothetical protein [Chloroflexota bacterium]
MHVRIAALTALVFALVFLVASAFAAAPPASADLSHAGDYCISCHSASDPRLADALTWDSSFTPGALSACPTIQQLRDELTFTGQQIDAVDHGVAGLVQGAAAQDLERQLLAREESVPRILDTDYHSVDAGVGAARTVAFQIDKTYAQVQTERDSWKTIVMLAVGIIVTMILVGSLAWGYANTRGVQTPAGRWLRFGRLGPLFVIALFLVFALPIFNPPTQSDIQAPAAATRQAALDAASSSAASAENASAKVWELGRISASAGPSSAELALTDAISTSAELAATSHAYWGRTQSLEESAVAWNGGTDAVPPLEQRIQVAASRTWATAALAEQVAASDPARATNLLSSALARAQTEPDLYFRSLDLKVISGAWARTDKSRSIQVANQIDDAFVRSWALRELGEFGAAAASARQVQDAYFRIYALREVGAASQDNSLMTEALTGARSLPEPSRAYALADLASAWLPFDANQAENIANSIDPSNAGARASAFGRIGKYQAAWAGLKKLPGGFGQSRAQSQLASEWARVSPADALAALPEIENPLLRDEAQHATVAVLAMSDATRALDLAKTISTPFVRAQALADVARVTHDESTFQQAADLADQLHDAYPLRDLAIAWAPLDPANALALVDKMDWEGDRAQALFAVAVALAPKDRAQANSIFDRAIKQAQAARLAGDPVYSAELLRELGAGYASVDAAEASQAFSAAVAAANQVSTGF